MNERLARVRKIMADKGLDGVIINGRANTCYLSGFTGSTSYLLIGLAKAWLVVDFRYTIQAKKEASEGVEAVEHGESFFATLDQILGDEKIANIGFEGENLSYSEYGKFTSKLTHASKFMSLGNEIDRIRIKKEDKEIEALARAVRMGDQVFDHILKLIKPGMTESELAAEIEYQMKKLGAKGTSFDTIVAAGERSAMCHASPTGNTLKKGDSVVLDFGVLYNNYCSDMTRTVFIGDPGEEMKKIYGIVKDAQQAALDCIASGMSGRDADKASRLIIQQAGYGKCFGHGLGHGVGIEIHEDPRLSEKSEDTLEDGMVFTVEPGIYVEGLGGVRIEDMVTLTGGRLKNFTASPKGMIIL